LENPTDTPRGKICTEIGVVRVVLQYPTAVPSVAHIAQAIKADISLAELEKYYDEENMRKVLY